MLNHWNYRPNVRKEIVRSNFFLNAFPKCTPLEHVRVVRNERAVAKLLLQVLEDSHVPGGKVRPLDHKQSLKIRPQVTSNVLKWNHKSNATVDCL